MSLLSIDILTPKPLSFGDVPSKSTRKLQDLAHRSIPEQDSFTQEEAVELIAKTTGTDTTRARTGLNAMVAAGAIERTPSGRYFLAGSTPF